VRKIILNTLLVVFATNTVYAAKRSATTATTEVMSSSSITHTECSMEDDYCEKRKVLERGYQQGLELFAEDRMNLLASNSSENMNVDLKKSLNVLREKYPHLKQSSNLDVLKQLIVVLNDESLLAEVLAFDAKKSATN
jgi:hypothetical protein